MERREGFTPGPEQPSGVRSEPTMRETMPPTVTRADIYGVMAPGMAAWPRDIIRWGPVFAGFFASLAVIVLLGVLGAAVGLQFVGGAAPGTAPGGDGTGAAIWGAIMLIIGFFVGGWIAGRTAAIVGATTGWMHGFVVWALTTTVLVALGAFGLGSAIGAIVSAGGAPVTTAATNISIAQGAAWGTFIALILGLIFAAIGGWVGGMMAETNQVTPTPPQVQAR